MYAIASSNRSSPSHSSANDAAITKNSLTSLLETRESLAPALKIIVDAETLVMLVERA